MGLGVPGRGVAAEVSSPSLSAPSGQCVPPPSRGLHVAFYSGNPETKKGPPDS